MLKHSWINVINQINIVLTAKSFCYCIESQRTEDYNMSMKISSVLDYNYEFSYQFTCCNESELLMYC